MKRPLGQSGIEVTSVALGCWPMAGVTTLGATHADGVATVLEALESGINHLDTAYVYGPNGESDRILAEALEGRRDEFVLASKVGVHYELSADGDPVMVTCGRPEKLRSECDELLQRLKVDQVDLLYLHSVDPEVPVAESAGALAELLKAGKTRAVGASNTQLEQSQEFATACPLSAIQLPYNLLQRDIEKRTIPWAQEQGISLVTYWPLMKGLLAGGIQRQDRLAEEDSRRAYPMYQGEEWQRNHDFVDKLRAISEEAGITVAQLVVNWTLRQAGITSVLCGAKRARQIHETAAAMHWQPNAEQIEKIEQAISERGQAVGKRSFS